MLWAIKRPVPLFYWMRFTAIDQHWPHEGAKVPGIIQFPALSYMLSQNSHLDLYLLSQWRTNGKERSTRVV